MHTFYCTMNFKKKICDVLRCINLVILLGFVIEYFSRFESIESRRD